MIPAIFKRHRAFLFDATQLISSGTVAMLIGVALIPIISRLFTPEDFGLATLVRTIGGIFGVVAALRYEQAIILPKDSSSAVHLTWLSLALTLLTGVALMLLVIAIQQFAPDLPLVTSLGNWIYAIPLVSVLLGANKVFSDWCSRVEEYGALGKSEIMSSLVLGGTRLLSGVISGSSVAGLMAGSFAASLAKCAWLLGVTRRTGGLKVYTGRKNDLRRLAYEYRDFPIFSAPTGVVRALVMKMPLLMLGVMFAPAVVGLYAMALRLARMPINVVSDSLRRVYIQRIARLQAKGKPITGALLKTTLGMIATGFLPFMLIALYGQELFGWVLSSKWADSGVYASIAVPWLFSAFIISPATTNFVVLKRQSLWFRLQFLAGICGLTVFIAGMVLDWDSFQVLEVFSYTFMVINTCFLMIVFRVTRNADQGLA